MRSARDDGPLEPVGRAVVRTGEIRLKCYQPDGCREAKNPPWQSQIIRRSGFREKKATVAAVPSREKPIAIRRRSIPGSRLLTATCRGAGRAAAIATSGKSGRSFRRKPSCAISPPTSSRSPPSGDASADHAGRRRRDRRSQAQPKRDSMVQLAGADG